MLAIDRLTEYINAYENETHGLVEIQVLKNAVNALKRCDNHRRRYSLCNLIFTKGYTPLSLAKDMKVCPSTVYGWLNGTKKPSAKMKHRIADFLGVTYEKIIDVCELTTECDELRDIIERQKMTILEYNEKDDRQKAEIERLTAEINQRREMMSRMDCNYATELQKNAELQKQVDESKEQRDVFKNLFENCNNSSITTEEIINAMNSFYREQAQHLAELKIEQAVKDTAKEILDDLRNIFIEQSSYGCDANQHVGYYDYGVKISLVIEQIEEYAKEKYSIEYSVEAE